MQRIGPPPCFTDIPMPVIGERSEQLSSGRKRTVTHTNKQKSSGDAGSGVTTQSLTQQRILAAAKEWTPEKRDAALKAVQGGEMRFPPGPRALSPGLVGVVERERLIAAVLELSAEVGWRGFGIDDIGERAGLERSVLYRHCAKKEELFLKALQAVEEYLRDRVEEAVAGGENWRERVLLALEAVARFVVAEPAAAKSLLVEARSAGPAPVHLYETMVERYTKCLEEQIGNEHLNEHSALTPDGIVGGVASFLYTRLVKGEVDEVEALVPSLQYFALVPYLGHGGASAEIEGHAAS